MPILINPKDGARLETKLSEKEALDILRKKSGNFPQDLCAKYPNLSPAQWYWFYKIASDEMNTEAIELHSDVEVFVRVAGIIRFAWERMENEELQRLGTLKLVAEKNCVKVFCGGYFQGEIIKNQYYPRRNTPIVTAQLILFSLDPMAVMETFGRETGICCICGRLLENPESVARGIGPICAEKYS